MTRKIIIIQARLGSQRLHKKMLRDLCGKPLIQRVLERVNQSNLIDDFILAVPDSQENEELLFFAEKNNYISFQGKENDVLDRFFQAAKTCCNDLNDNTIILRACADNPFIDPSEIDRLISFFMDGEYDYAFNNRPADNNMYPDGLGAEIFKFSLLKKLWENAVTKSHREHVTLYALDNSHMFNIGTLKAPIQIAFPEIKLDIDTEEDFKWVEKIYSELNKKYGEKIFSSIEIVQCALSLKK